MWGYGQCMDNIKGIINELNSMFSMLIELLTNDSLLQTTTTSLPSLMSAIKATALTLCVMFFLIDFFTKSLHLQWVTWENVLMLFIKLVVAKVCVDNAELFTTIADLPIIPSFEFVPIENVKPVLARLDKLMNSKEVDEIICATDAGREGECIFRYIYNYVGCKKPFKRLWISSLTAESIRNGFNHLLPAAEKDNMFSAGITRAKIDWLWGMNMTRLYTKHFGALCSDGRVQTAVVNMIAERDNEIDHFTKKPYFKLKFDNGAEWFDDERESFPTRAEAERVKAKCENSPCKVVFVNAKQKKENRPLLFSLTSLQVEANDKLGFSAATTLAVMQAPLAIEAELCLFVMVTTGNNIELFVLNLIHKPVNIVNAATPIATQIVL